MAGSEVSGWARVAGSVADGPDTAMALPEVPLAADGTWLTIDPTLRSLWAALCNDARGALRRSDEAVEVVGDPTEVALVVLAREGRHRCRAERAPVARLAEVPFDSTTKCMATLHARSRRPGELAVLAVKGAPDVVLGGHLRSGPGGTLAPSRLDAAPPRVSWRSNAALGSLGLRVLAVASRRLPVRAREYEGELASEELRRARPGGTRGDPRPRPARGGRGDRTLPPRRRSPCG